MLLCDRQSVEVAIKSLKVQLPHSNVGQVVHTFVAKQYNLILA